jgi:hypothetical protein
MGQGTNVLNTTSEKDKLHRTGRFYLGIDRQTYSSCCKKSFYLQELKQIQYMASIALIANTYIKLQCGYFAESVFPIISVKISYHRLINVIYRTLCCMCSLGLYRNMSTFAPLKCIRFRDFSENIYLRVSCIRLSAFLLWNSIKVPLPFAISSKYMLNATPSL